MHTELNKTPELSHIDSGLSGENRLIEKKETFETERISAIGSSFPIDPWISKLGFKQFFYLNRDYTVSKNLNASHSLEKRLKMDTHYDGNIHYLCIDYLKYATDQAMAFEAMIRNERLEKHGKAKREEQKKELWLKLKNKFQEKLQQIKENSKLHFK